MKALKLNGISSVTAGIPIQLTQTDFSGVVQKLRSANADAVLLNAAGPQLAPILQAAQSVGYDPYWIVTAGSQSASIFKTAAALSKKFYFASNVPVFLAPGNTQYPPINTMRAEMAKYGGSDGSPANQDESSIFTWFSTHGLIDVLAQTKGNVTAATYTAAMQQAKNVDIEGLWKWTPGDRFPNISEPYAYVGHADNGYAVYDARVAVLPALK
jgi:ABC-type branched-subunit amino acid transport system substrate-binding protein